MKKLLGLGSCLALVFSLVVPVSAASNINVEEQRLLDYLDTGITAGGENLSFPVGSDEYQAVRDLLEVDGVDLTAGDVDTIKIAAIEFEAYLDTNFEEIITVESINDIIDIINPAAEVFGLKMAYDAVNDSLNILDGDGNVVYNIEEILGAPIAPEVVPGTKEPVAGNKLENTGDDYGMTFGVIGFLAVAMIASGIALNKKKTNI